MHDEFGPENGQQDSIAMDQEFHRVRRLPPYVFAEVNAMKADARAENYTVPTRRASNETREAYADLLRGVRSDYTS